MPYFVSSTVPDDSPVGVPLIGWDNVVTSANVTSATAQTGFPITNVANPATHLKWKGGINTGIEYVTISGINQIVNYVGIAGHNFGTGEVIVSVEAIESTQILLHFNGTNGSTTITDNASTATSTHTWTARATAALSTAQVKFGSASLFGSGSSTLVDTPDSADFFLGSSDFTIDFWIRPDSTTTGMFGQNTDANNGMFCASAGGTINFTIKVASVNVVSATKSGLTTGTWQHVAVVRSGSTWTVFLDGVGGTPASYSGSVPDWTGVFMAGSDGVTASLTGYMDEFRLSVGSARWTANFTPPTAETGFTTLVSATEANSPDNSALDDDTPIVLRFARDRYTSLRIGLNSVGLINPEMAVLYVGDLLVLERSITIGKGHVPITFGRRTTVVNGMSETGNFLGRVVIGEWRESKAEFEWFTPQYYRSDIDAFLAFAQEAPFFWVWSPDEFPEEAGYVWLTNNAEPEHDPATRRVALTLQMRGVA